MPHLMTAATAVHIVQTLQQQNVGVTVGGGWAVDALLGQQTRDHEDLDLWLTAADLDPLIPAFVGLGIDRLLPWGGDRPWNFVLHDGGHLRVDLHLYEPLPDGLLHYGSVTTKATVFPAAALAGHGTIAAVPVTCDSPSWALTCHTGYPPRPVDHHDVTLLCARFQLELPTAYR